MFNFVLLWFLAGVLVSMFMSGARDASFSRADQAFEDDEQFNSFKRKVS